MPAERDTKPVTGSPWREAADLARFVAEAAGISGAIVLLAWVLS
jgi:hypothetical protein